MRSLRLTQGQRYSSAITMAVAVLLLTGLGNVHGVAGSALAQPPLGLAPVAELPPVSVPTSAPVPVPASTPPLLALPPFHLGARPFPLPLPMPAPAPEDPGPSPAPSAPPGPTPTPTAGPCSAAPVNDAAKVVLATLNGPAGGRLPDEDVMAALQLVTGCSSADPAVVALGVLIGIGQTIPDPGLPAPPVLPTAPIPEALVTALQPARSSVDLVCGLVGTGNTVVSLFISAYPRPVAPLTTQVLFQALYACGQVRTP